MLGVLALGENLVIKRVTVTLKVDDIERLQFISERTGLSKNDSIRKALATQVWVGRMLAAGRKILVEDGKGNIREVVFN